MKAVYLIVWSAVACIMLMGAAGAPHVTVESNILSVRAKEVPLSKILAAIGDQTEVKFVLMEGGKVEDERVSEEFEEIPLELGIARLLRGFSYSFIKDEQTGALKQVNIIRRGTPSAISDEKSSNLLNPSRSGFLGPSSATARTETTDDAVTQAINEALAEKDPGVQAEALWELSEMQHSGPLDALTPALRSENSKVRQATLEAMRWGTVQEAFSLQEVRRLAAEDPDPNVRRAALEVLVRYDTTQEGRALLEKVAEGKGADRRFQGFAKQHLRRMDKEAAAVAAGDPQVDQQAK